MSRGPVDIIYSDIERYVVETHGLHLGMSLPQFQYRIIIHISFIYAYIHTYMYEPYISYIYIYIYIYIYLQTVFSHAPSSILLYPRVISSGHGSS
jgi:hypothetical protein